MLTNNLTAKLPGEVKLITEGSGANTKYYIQLGADAASKKLLGNSISNITAKAIFNHGLAYPSNPSDASLSRVDIYLYIDNKEVAKVNGELFNMALSKPQTVLSYNIGN